MRSPKYPSDVTDEQWALIEPLIPVYPGGRPRKTDVRDVLDAIFYLLRAGCQWRYLPKDLPPKSTVWRYFGEWRHNGTLDATHDALRRKARTAGKPYAPRTTAGVDSRSADATSGGEQRGRDSHKNVNGRKRHVVVDSRGRLLAVLVTAASTDDARAARGLFGRPGGQPVGRVRRVFADTKYHNFAPYEWVGANAGWEPVIVRRPDGERGWVGLPLRWAVGRAFAWPGRCRRPAADRGGSVRSSGAFVKLAMIHLMLNRLEPKAADPEFRYRTAA
jgi:putative transposase